MCTECRTYPHDPRCPYAPESVYYCPVCGEELDSSDKVYENLQGEIFACCSCLQYERASSYFNKEG